MDTGPGTRNAGPYVWRLKRQASRAQVNWTSRADQHQADQHQADQADQHQADQHQADQAIKKPAGIDSDGLIV